MRINFRFSFTFAVALVNWQLIYYGCLFSTPTRRFSSFWPALHLAYSAFLLCTIFRLPCGCRRGRCFRSPFRLLTFRLRFSLIWLAPPSLSLKQSFLFPVAARRFYRPFIYIAEANIAHR